MGGCDASKEGFRTVGPLKSFCVSTSNPPLRRLRGLRQRDETGGGLGEIFSAYNAGKASAGVREIISASERENFVGGALE